MSKWFEMKVETWQVVLVEVEDDQSEEDAMNAAHDECMDGKDGQISDAVLVDFGSMESKKRHADKILPL